MSVTIHQLGGWDLGEIPQNLSLFKVTIFTYIDSWDDYYLALNEIELQQALEIKYPIKVGNLKPTIKQLNVDLDAIYVVNPPWVKNPLDKPIG